MNDASAIQQGVKTIEAVVNQVQSWPVSLALVVAIVCAAYSIDFVRAIPNRFILPVCFVCGITFNILVGDRGRIDPSQRNIDVVLGIYGAALGFLAWLVFVLIAKRIERFLASRKSGTDADTEEDTEPKPRT